MDRLLENDSWQIKKLLKLWIDPEQDYYILQKRYLKEGLTFKAKIQSKYLPYLFEGSNQKTIYSSLLPRIYNKNLVIQSRACLSNILRNNNCMTFVYTDELFEISIETAFGSLELHGQCFNQELNADQVSAILPPKGYGLKEEYLEISFKVKLLEEGRQRQIDEKDSNIYSSEMRAVEIYQDSVRNFREGWSTKKMPQPLMDQRLNYYGVDSPELISFKKTSLTKNVLLYQYFTKKMADEYYWFITNDDCLLDAENRFKHYMERYNNLVQKLESKIIDLNKVKAI
jgi:hypothetical protein